MKNQWLIWAFVLGVVIIVLFAFNYQGKKEAVPLSQIFPEETTQAAPAKSEAASAPVQTGAETTTAMPAQKTVQPAASARAKSSSETAMAAKPAVPALAATAPAAVPVKKHSATRAKTKTHRTYTIQVVSLHKEAWAQRELKKVVAAGYPGRVVKKDLGSKGVWYRIYVGSFTNKAQAEDYLQKVRKNYKGSFVISQ